VTVNNDVEGMWDKVVVAYFKVLSLHLYRETQEANHKYNLELRVSNCYEALTYVHLEDVLHVF
jgi:hypothetical protein